MSSLSLKNNKQPRAHAYIDASNLFYGGKKSLGWSIDYKKLAEYLKQRYNCKQLYYFGGIETYKFPYNYVANETVPLDELLKYLRRVRKNNLAKKKLIKQLDKYIQRAKFYKKLQKFGYKLVLKPVKIYIQPDGTKRLKANCDLDMALMMTKNVDKYDRAMVLSGDGDFLAVLKHIRHCKKEVILLARSKRTAKEIKHFAGAGFRDFDYLKYLIGQSVGTPPKKNPK